MNFYVVPFKVIPLRYNTLVPAYYPILKALLILIFWYVLELSQRFGFYLLNRGKTPSFHGSLQSWEHEKCHRGLNLVNTVAKSWLRWFFWPKNYEQAMTSEQVRYRDAKAMNCFSTISGVSSVLIHANGALLQGNTPD